MRNQDRRCLLRLLDAMDDHFDQRISDQEFLREAITARDSLTLPAAHDPALEGAIRALEGFLNAAKGGPLPAEPYDNLRFELAELVEPLEGSLPATRQPPAD